MCLDLRKPCRTRRVVVAATFFAVIVATAISARATVSPYGGVYVIAPSLQQPASPTLAASFYASPDIDGIYMPIVWGVIEPALDVYDWRTVDPEVEAAVANNKKIEIAVFP